MQQTYARFAIVCLASTSARSLALSVALGLAIVWSGLAIAYYSPYPVGFWISAVALSTYGGARLVAA